MRKIVAVRSLQILYMFVLRAEKITTFEPLIYERKHVYYGPKIVHIQSVLYSFIDILYTHACTEPHVQKFSNLKHFYFCRRLYTTQQPLKMLTWHWKFYYTKELLQIAR